jgi:hypothetical protein
MRQLPQSPRYEITENGDVYSSCVGKNKRKLKPCRDSKGYLKVVISYNFKRKTTKIHKLVAEVYLPKRPSPLHIIRHLDGNPANNHYTNLAWGTYSENEADKEKHNRVSRCERNGRAKLTQEQVDYIRNFLSQSIRGGQKELSSVFGVKQNTISAIFRNKRWAKRIDT